MDLIRRKVMFNLNSADPFAEAAADPFQSSTTPTAATADPFGQADPFGSASGFGNNDFADFSKFASFPS